MASKSKSSTADFGKRQSEVDPKLCELRGACGCLDLYLDLRRNWYASKICLDRSTKMYSFIGKSETLNCPPFENEHRCGKVNGLIFV